MEVWDKRLERVTTALAYFACAIVALVFTMIVVDVLVRAGCTASYNLFGDDYACSPPSFTLAVVEYSLLWFAMSAAPYLVRQRGHVTIEAVVSIVPDAVARMMAKIVYAVCFAISLLFAYYSMELFLETFESQEPDVRGIDMPYWLLFLPMPFGFFLVAMEFLRYLIGPASYYSYDLGEVKDEL